MTYILKTYTKSEYEITDDQEAQLRRTGLEGKIIINSSTIMANNIAEITKVKEETDYRQIEAPERVVYSKEQFIKALSEIIKGFKKHFGDRQLPQRSQTILSHMEFKLEKAKQSTDKRLFENPVKAFYNKF